MTRVRRSCSITSTPIAVLCAAVFVLAGCGERTVRVAPSATVRITDVRNGIGEKAEEGKLVMLHYTAELSDGTVIMDTYKRGRPHRFVIGDGSVIPGMVEGIRGMRSGGKRILKMPPAAHYGMRGHGGAIPPNETLKFEVELVRVREPDGSRAGRLHPNDPRRTLFGQQNR